MITQTRTDLYEDNEKCFIYMFIRKIKSRSEKNNPKWFTTTGVNIFMGLTLRFARK